MRRQMTLGAKLFLGFGAALTLTIVMGGYSVFALTSIGRTVSELAHSSLKKATVAGRMSTAMSDIIADERGLMFAAVRQDAAGVQQAARDFTQHLDVITRGVEEIRPLISSAEGLRMVDALARGTGQIKQVHEELLQTVNQQRVDDAVKLLGDRVMPAVLAVNRTAEELEAHQARIAIQMGETSMSEIMVNRTLMLVAVLCAVAIGIAIFFVVRTANAVLTTAIRTLREGAEQVVAASGQVSAASQSLSQGATEQAASLEETSASMEEMSSMTRQNAENSKQVAAMMTDVNTLVSDSNGALSEMVASMGQIEDSSRRVSKIIKTIDEIAFQTNILALNAAVEAARAGDAGMGFAVVADEVRSLAQRSAQAAKDTAQLIEEAIGNAQQGTQRVELVASSISSITTSVTRMQGLVRDVSDASTQQAQGIDQVAQAISQMEKVTQSNAAGAEESAAASEELNAQAETTMAEIARLDAMITGASGGQQARFDHHHRDAGAGVRAGYGRLPAATGRAHRAARLTAEQQLPLESGSYGKF